jgi:hypothetical protein
VLGSEPQILFHANRRSATSYIDTYPLMESHPYAVQMQEDMIRQIETAKPKFLIFVNVPSSWPAEPTSSRLIFDWFQQYQDQHYRTVGVIDLLSEDQTIYCWNQNAAGYTPRSQFWIRALQRTSDS